MFGRKHQVPSSKANPTVAILLPILGATLALSGFLVVVLLGLFLSYRLLHHILDQTQDAAAIDGIISGLRIWLDETRSRVPFLAAPAASGSVDNKPFLWEPGSTPRGFSFRQSSGFPSQGTNEDEEGDSTHVKTEKIEDEDWVSDADAGAEAPIQATPGQQRATPLKAQTLSSSSPQVSSPLANSASSHTPSGAQSPPQPQPPPS